MTELNIGALTDSTSYTGSVDTTNIFDLYKFNINSPGSFQLSIDGLSGNADIFLLNSSGATLYSSSNAGTSAETISADSLVAGDYSVKVLPISSDIKYTLNLAPTSAQKSSDADTLTGAKSDSLLPSNSATTSEKPTANKDVITGTPVDDKTVTAETTSTTTDKPVTSASETTLTSEPEPPVAATESAAAITSTTTDKPVTTSSETTLTSEAKKPVTATESAVETTSITTDKPVTTSSETTLTSEPEKPIAATESASKKLPIEETKSPPDKPTDSAISTAEKPSETAATNNPNSTAAAKTDAVAGETVATQEPKTGETLVATSPDASKPRDETNTDTSNGEETNKENTTTTVATTETKKEPEATTDKKLMSPFTSGIFTTDQTGRISVDYTFDGGMFQGELAIFSLDDLDKFEPGSEAFIKEVAARSLSNSVKGHVVINDATEGARFSGLLGESNANEGVYLGVKSFAVTAGGKYGVMLVPNGSVKSVFDNPTVGGDQRPLFSMAMANPVEGFHFGQIADLTGEGNTFIMEDMRLDAGSDRDYNDIIFQVRGATATTALVDSVINPDKEWRKTDLGKALIAYAKPYITPEPKQNVDAELSDLLDDLETEILNPSTSDRETPKTPAPATNTDKDTTDSTKVETTDKVDAKPTTPAVTTEEEVKDIANNSGDSTKVETTDQVDAKPTTGATTTPTADKDTVADSSEKLPVEKTPVSAAKTEVKDEVAEAPATATVPAQSTFETEVAATTSTEKVETKPEVLPAESLTKVETKSEVLPAETQTGVETKPEVLPAESKAKEELKPALVTEVEKTEATQVVVVANPVESVKESQPTTAVESKETAEDKQPSLPLKETDKAESSTVTLPESSVDSTVKESQPTGTVESQETAEVKPSLPLQETDLESLAVTTANKSDESQMKEIIAKTPAVSDVVIPKESLPSLPIVDSSTEDDSATVENPQPSIDVFPTGSEVDYSISANLIARLESMKQSLTNLGSADDPGGNSSNETLIARLESVTQKLMTFNESTTVSDNIVALVDRLEETVDRLTIPPIQPPLQSVDASQFDFPVENQPIIGVIDTGFAGNNPDIDYSRITWGQDRVDGDADPRLEPGKGNEHGTHILGIIAATQNNGVGIDGVNEKAPIWAGRAIGSGKWAESLVEYVDFVKSSGKKNGLINLSMDLTQINADGTTTTRYELTLQERGAIEYARQNGVMIVVAAGNDGAVMSALGQSSQEFDNIITVGAAERFNDEIALSKAYDRTNYSSYGQGLDILASGGTNENPVLSTVGDGVGFMAGTSAATAKVTGAASQVWAANPALSFRQVIDILKATATDLKETNSDSETGAGLLNIEAAVNLAKAITPEKYEAPQIILPETWNGEGLVTPMERAVRIPYTFRSGDSLWRIAQQQLGNGARWVEIKKANGSSYTSQEATTISIGTVVYLPGNSPSPSPTPSPTPSPSPSPTPTPTPVGSLAGKKIALDPGHGNSPGIFDPGAVASGTTEAIENMVQAQIIANYLRQRGAEVKIIDDASLGLEQIGQQSKGSDLFVSLHLNSSSGNAQGHEVFSHPLAPAVNSKLARTINSEIDAVFPDSEIPNRGTKIANFGVLRGANTVPSVLVESLFINAPGMSRANVEKAAQAVARGIEKFLTGNISNPGSGNNNSSGSSTDPATPGKQRQYIIKPGDILTGIAQRELGNANRWREIVKNPTGGTFTEAEARQLRVGDSVYLPVSYQTGTGTPVKQVPTSNPNQTNFETGRVSSRVGSIPLNLRSQSNTSQTPIGTLPVGTELKILRTVNGGTYNPGTGNRNDWYEVEVNGKRGFVAAYFVDKGSSAPPPPQDGFVNSKVGGGPLNLRSSASTNAGVLTNLNGGTKLKILQSVTGGTYNPGTGNRNDWYQVEVNGKRGFVAAYYVTKGTNSGSGGGGNNNGGSNLVIPVDWNSPAYRQNNPLWQYGYAPKFVNPPKYSMSNPNAKGNCTWYANGRLRQLGYSSGDLNRLLGNASEWDNLAIAAGIPVSRTPKVGAIAQWESNHVAVVEQVNSDGTIVISESSYWPTSPHRNDYLYNRRTIRASDPTQYIHVRR